VRETVKPFKALILVLTLLPLSGIVARAESASINDAAIIKEIISSDAHPNFRSTPFKRAQLKTRCNPWKRALVGGAVGAIVAMVAVRKAAESNDGTAGMKTTLQAGGYGGALGMFVGLATCR
jgi:hypothetical protein